MAFVVPVPIASVSSFGAFNAAVTSVSVKAAVSRRTIIATPIKRRWEATVSKTFAPRKTAFVFAAQAAKEPEEYVAEVVKEEDELIMNTSYGDSFDTVSAATIAKDNQEEKSRVLAQRERAAVIAAANEKEASKAQEPVEYDAAVVKEEDDLISKTSYGDSFE
mmetsp:Transcript_4455/g.7780  ORF Transcript_4455/g.7780 Transcript_4455/m.7780 type:complete len:163 (-) Transcript_4455:852-1340(-)|eukprot:CAMPEP_0196663582 /NCGR_PEP_ID=MMETSP1086-20130531/53430_1 /TAXON_ID=77921 /ORGANISM="Cyanoptyche  gloeocystis , Strain SAG4.97" /LENGTH=162 /DNA_ID=CAMNT_0041999459 /DNA_START=64 /DNA_END=552 /DNA_ORIENTATION=+